jgi:3-oxoacyl-[acyl-carrier-protein] synthase-1
VFATAHRYMATGLCDAAVVGGVDSLCLMTLYGFRSLDLVSSRPCRPWDAERDGISIGEGAGFALLEKDLTLDHRIQFLGYGESSDGYHMSSPHPEGIGAALAMKQALQCAGIGPQQVDYTNLHGTGTRANDVAEDKAMIQVMGPDTICSSTKGFTGHTLGAAGITEAILTCLCIESDLVPGTINTRNPDPKLATVVRLDSEMRTVGIALSSSFGFGGSNCSLVFGKAR